MSETRIAEPSIHPLNHSWPLDERRAEAITIKNEALGLFSSQTGCLVAHSLTGSSGEEFLLTHHGQTKVVITAREAA